MSLVPELAIGELDGLPDLVFGRVGAIDLDSEGRLYVVDAQARQIRVFSSTGEHLRTFGGTGDGPGEFRSPGHLRATSDGRIVVRDNMGGGRFSVFTDEGAYLGGWPLASGYSTNAPFHLDQQQRVVNPTFPDRLVVYDLDGGAQDTIANPSRGYEPTRLEAVFASGRASYPVPFMPREVWTMTRDGRILFGLSNEYSVERWEDDGVSFRIERRAESVPVLRAEADRAREAVTSTIRSSNDPNWRWDGPDIPSVKPVFETIHPGLDGTIWVFRNGPSTEVPNPGWDPEQPQAAPRTWFSSPVVADVFEEDGQYLGPVRIPEVVAWGLPPAVLTREWIWASTMHPDGYPQVVRFRVAPG